MYTWTEGDVQAADIRLHYHRTGGTDKPAVLLLHGITDNALCWSRLARDLEDSYDVVMTDARGHGASSPIAGNFSIDLLASDAAAVIEALHLHQPAVIGHSMGGITAALLAANYPHLVRAVVLEDPPIGDDPLPNRSGPEQLQALYDLRALPREERLRQALSDRPDWSPEEVVPWSDSKVQFDIEVAQHRAVFRALPWRDVLSRIHCPVLLITGDPDRGALVTPALADAASHLCQNATVAHIPGAGHSIHRDRYDETPRYLLDFLRAN
jgi:N-formylmaleamate deformylase